MDFEAHENSITINNVEFDLSVEKGAFMEKLTGFILEIFKEEKPYPQDYYSTDKVGEYGSVFDNILESFLTAGEEARANYLATNSPVDAAELKVEIGAALSDAYTELVEENGDDFGDDDWWDFRESENIEDLTLALEEMTEVSALEFEEAFREAIQQHINDQDKSSIWDVVKGDLKIGANLTYNDNDQGLNATSDQDSFVKENFLQIKSIMNFCKESGHDVANHLLSDYGIDTDNLLFGLPIVKNSGDLADKGIFELLANLHGLMQLKGNPEKAPLNAKEIHEMLESCHQHGGNFYVAGKWDIKEILLRDIHEPLTISEGLIGIFEGYNGQGSIDPFVGEIEIPANSVFIPESKVGIDKCFGFTSQAWRSQLTVKKLIEDKPVKSFALTG